MTIQETVDCETYHLKLSHWLVHSTSIKKPLEKHHHTILKKELG